MWDYVWIAYGVMGAHREISEVSGLSELCSFRISISKSWII